MKNYVSNKFILVSSGGDLMKNVFADLAKSKEVYYIDSLLCLNETLLNYAKTFARKFGKYVISDIILYITDKIFSPLEHLDFSDGSKFLILLNPSIQGMSRKYLKAFLRKNSNIIPVLFFFDPVDKPMSRCAKDFLDKFPQFISLTFDPQDAKKYGMSYSPFIYSKHQVKQTSVEKDLYYIGGASDRLEKIIKIYESSLEHNVNNDINVFGAPDGQKRYSGKINYCSYILYANTVVQMMKCNGILEILQSGQSGATLRYYEAVCYNKKLLTNNKNVVNLPFYNPDYIHVFERPEDIDWNWVKERIPVDYHYDGRFSPTHLIDKIIELEEEKERKELGKVETD